MSFDPITGTWAAKKAAEIVGAGGGSSGGGLPVVELTTTPTAEGAELTAEESAKVTQAMGTGLPVVVKLVLDGAQLTTIGIVTNGIAILIDVVSLGVSCNIVPNENGGHSFIMFTSEGA